MRLCFYIFNALQRAIPISTILMQWLAGWKLCCVNALQRAIPISTHVEDKAPTLYVTIVVSETHKLLW